MAENYQFARPVAEENKYVRSREKLEKRVDRIWREDEIHKLQENVNNISFVYVASPYWYADSEQVMEARVTINQIFSAYLHLSRETYKMLRGTTSINITHRADCMLPTKIDQIPSLDMRWCIQQFNLTNYASTWYLPLCETAGVSKFFPNPMKFLDVREKDVPAKFRSKSVESAFFNHAYNMLHNSLKYSRARRMFVLELPDWESSTGVAFEIACAKRFQTEIIGVSYDRLVRIVSEMHVASEDTKFDTFFIGRLKSDLEMPMRTKRTEPVAETMCQR